MRPVSGFTPSYPSMLVAAPGQHSEPGSFGKLSQDAMTDPGPGTRDARSPKWRHDAPPGREEARKSAVAEINSMFNRGDKKLKLELAISTIPPLPDDLVELELRRTQIVSLEGMPLRMNALKTLLIIENEKLVTLRGMSQELRSLEIFHVSHTSLVDLQGMPQHLPALLSLFISSGGSFMSVGGMPPRLNVLVKLDLSDNPKLHWLQGISQEMNALKVLCLNGNRSLSSRLAEPEQLGELENLALDGCNISSLDDLPETIRNNHNLHISVSGTPLAEASIEAAREGRYRAWIGEW